MIHVNLDMLLAFLAGMGIAFGLSAGLIILLDAVFINLERSKLLWLSITLFSIGAIMSYLFFGPSNLEMDAADILRSIK